MQYVLSGSLKARVPKPLPLYVLDSYVKNTELGCVSMQLCNVVISQREMGKIYQTTDLQ